VGDVTIGASLELLDGVIGPWTSTARGIFLFLSFIKKTGKIRALQPLIGFLALVVGKLWPRKSLFNFVVFMT